MSRDTVLMGAMVLASAVGLGVSLWPSAEPVRYSVAEAVVLASASCGVPDARDTVRVELSDGRAMHALLDGCGNRPGEELIVEVPDPLPAGDVSGDVLVRLAGTGVPREAAVAQRFSAVGAAVAGMAGGLLAWRVRPGLVTATRPELTGRRV